MNYPEYAKYCQLMGYRVEETAHGVWIGISHGFFNRLPLYETTPPADEEMQSLFRRYPILGLHYALKPGDQGKAGPVFFVRDREYGLQHLQARMRTRVRRGLEHCQVRRMGFDELQSLGMPLNLDTLARQGRNDSRFSDPERWARFCQASQRVEGAQAWGAFVGEDLAAYLTLFRLGGVVNILYVNSRACMMKLQSNPALNFTVTQTMMRTPGIEAVCFGPGGHWSSKGLDDYKHHMGFDVEPVVFAVRLRPVMRTVLFSLGGRRIINGLGRWLSHKHIYQRVQAVLDLAALSS